MIPRGHTLVSKALRNAARGEVCVRCERPVKNETVVLCHLPLNAWGFGSSMAGKCPDWLGAHLCDECHAWIDGPDGRRDAETRGRVLAATLARLFDNGTLQIKGERHDVDIPF